MESKIKQCHQIPIGRNVRAIRLACGVGQTKLATLVQLSGVGLTRETLVKIERGTQHVSASQLKAIRDILCTTYDALLQEQS